MQIRIDKDVNERIEVPIFKGYFELFITDDVNKILDKHQHFVDFDLNKGFYANAFKTKSVEGCVLYLITINKKDLTHGIIAHEIEHIKNMIFFDCEIVPDSEYDEEDAYLIEWLTDQVYTWISNSKNKE